MNENYTYSVPAAAKWIAAFAVAEWLAMPAAMRALLIFMCLDYGTGLVGALMRGEASSSAGFRGLIRKGLILVLLLTAHLIESMAGLEVHVEQALAVGYTINEAISIIENLARSGVPIPATLVQALMTVQKFRIQQATQAQLQELEESVHPEKNGLA